jgi:hypothetical protein
MQIGELKTPVIPPQASKQISKKYSLSLASHILHGRPRCLGMHQREKHSQCSLCESKIDASDEGTKLALTVPHLLKDSRQIEGRVSNPLWNHNCRCVNWTKGVSLSKKLRHMNIHELGVCLAQTKGDIDVQHIKGKCNIANLFTKEIKDSSHFQQMAFTITTPRFVAGLEPKALVLMKGGVESRSLAIRYAKKHYLIPKRQSKNNWQAYQTGYSVSRASINYTLV